jgi:sodium/proline symporter
MMVTVFVLYLVMLLVVGAVASRYGRSMVGYFLADRRLGPWVTAISATASSESGWLVVGLVGEAYMFGAKAVCTAHGCLLGFLMNWYLVAPRLRAQSGKLDAITVPDYLASRFGGSARSIRMVGVLIIVVVLLGYVAAQFTATGKAFQGAFGISYQAGVLIGAAITVIYTLVGGFRAVSWTDLVQGLLMVFGLVILPIVTVQSVGGLTEMRPQLQKTPAREVGVFEVARGTRVEEIGVEETAIAVEPEGLELARMDETNGAYFVAHAPSYMVNGEDRTGLSQVSAGDVIEIGNARVTFGAVREMVGGENYADAFGGAVGLALLGWVIGLYGIGLGYPGQPHILTRFMAASSVATVRRARLIAMLWGVFVLYGAIVLGNAARIALPDLVDPEQAYPTLAANLLPPVIAGLVLAAIVSAMMSTADSQLLVVSSAVARDLVQKAIAPRWTDRALQLVSRGTVLVVGLVALGVALGEVRAVFWFVLFAWSGLGAAFGPPVLLSLFWTGTSRQGVLAGMITGFGVTVIWKLWLKGVVASATGLSLYELVPAFAASLLATWLVSRLIPPTPAEEAAAAELIDSSQGDRVPPA